MNMKKLIFSILALSIVLCAKAQSHHKDSVRNTYRQEVLLNPFAFFVGGFEMGYGKINAANNRLTRGFAGYYISENAEPYGDDFKNMEGARFEIQHLFIKPTDGRLRYYAGGFLVYKTIKIDKKVSPTVNYFETIKGSAVSFGLIVGVRNYVADNFFIDLFIGGGPTIPVGGGDGEYINLDVVNPYKRSINPKAGLTFGIAF